MALHLCNLHQRFYGKPIVTIRPFTFFGPGERATRLIPSVILSILKGCPIRITSGTQTRDYTYVDDMVRAFLSAGVANKAIGEIINVGSGKDLPVREIAERIRNLMNADVPIEVGAVETRKDEAWRLCCDNSKAQMVLGWKPSLTFDEGIRRTVEWLKRGIIECKDTDRLSSYGC
jgi:nucleoside-diphosphate-sugar epimerase